MGKHSLPDSPGFWRAVTIAGLRYLVVVAVVAAVAFGIYKVAFENDGATPDTEETLSPLPTDPFLEETPPEATPSSEPAPSEAPPATGKTQVLDGSDSQARLDAAEAKLEEAGYEVVAKGTAATPRELTTVFYHPGSQQLGEAVASLLGATLVQPVGDLRLDPSIPVTVVVGADYAG